MDAVGPRVRVKRLSYAPKTFPCPHCGKKGRRKDVHTRCVRDIAYREIVVLEIEVGEYRARCSCCKTFRAQVEGIEPRAEYTNRVREAVIDRLLDDRMSMERLRQALERDFYLNLSDGFLYDCLDWKVRQVDLPAYRQWTLEHFSGTLCVDEIHLGHRTLLLATDPVNDFPVAFALVRANDQDHMRRFLKNLQNWGLAPQVVVTDGSNLYPAVLAEIWPQARHQLCVFHVLKDINEHVFDALRRLRQRLARQGTRPRRRGRPSKAQKRARARYGKSKKEQAYFIWKHRHLIVTRPEHLSGRERRWLSQMFRSLPALRTLRQFVLAVYRLFDPDQSPHQARCRRAALVKTAKFLADPDLAQALDLLTPDKFDKMIAYLHSPAGQRVRTNNHVERVNRRLRYFEKVRYKWRRRRTIVRFIVLAIDRWYQQRGQPRAEPKVIRKLRNQPQPSTTAHLTKVPA
jgi:transposase-like protein/transcription elongation factor Elf1